LTGLSAYYSVNHDAPSHLAMIKHRNWALLTAVVMVALTLWSLWRTYKNRSLTLSFMLALFITQGLVLCTTWHGAELVFRYGVGVMSLPKAQGEGHGHHPPAEVNMILSPNIPAKTQETTPGAAE
jgi:uncharacterized membrane protein